MALKLSHTDLVRAKDQAERLAHRAKAHMGKAEHVMKTFVRSAEVSLASFGLGLAQGRFGSVEVLGVPLELVIAGGGHLAAFGGLAGSYSGHLHNIADGALGVYMATLGAKVGNDMKQKAIAAGGK